MSPRPRPTDGDQELTVRESVNYRSMKEMSKSVRVIEENPLREFSGLVLQKV